MHQDRTHDLLCVGALHTNSLVPSPYLQPWVPGIQIAHRACCKLDDLLVRTLCKPRLKSPGANHTFLKTVLWYCVLLLMLFVSSGVGGFPAWQFGMIVMGAVSWLLFFVWVITLWCTAAAGAFPGE